MNVEHTDRGDSHAVMTLLPREPQPIAALIQRGRDIGLTFPRHPSHPNGVQVRVTRDAPPEAHELAAELRGRRAEVDAFFAARRPAWPNVDDRLPPPIPLDVSDEVFFVETVYRLGVDAIVGEYTHALRRLRFVLDQQFADLTAAVESARRRLDRCDEREAGQG